MTLKDYVTNDVYNALFQTVDKMHHDAMQNDIPFWFWVAIAAIAFIVFFAILSDPI